MIVFELTMPNVGSWNGKWTGANRLYVRTRKEREVPKDYWNKSFFYRWDDGWTARVSTIRMPVAEARRLERKSNGFRGYDWMIESIIKYGGIFTEQELEE